MIVVVLDMDETLGVYQENVFQPRPKLDFFLKMLRAMDIDIILWSLGEDDYVRRVVEGFLPSVKKYTQINFARSECKLSKELYGYYKASQHIRQMYKDPVFLIGVDDKVTENMDSSYDVRIHVPPYRKPDGKDRQLLRVSEEIVDAISSVKDLTPIQFMSVDYM